MSVTLMAAHWQGHIASKMGKSSSGHVHAIVTSTDLGLNTSRAPAGWIEVQTHTALVCSMQLLQPDA
jgi:hypothetical protein